MKWLGLALFFLLIAPVRAGAVLRWDEKGARAQVGVMVWGARARASLTLERNREGRLLLTAAGGRPLSLPRRRKGAESRLKILALLIKSNGRHSALRKAVRLTQAEAALRLGGGDAALLALGTCLIRALNGALPGARLRCVPALGGKSALYARCIAETRLGILLVALLRWRSKAAETGPRRTALRANGKRAAKRNPG